MAKRWTRALSAEDLGRFLSDLRIERGLTQAQLAEDLGISRRYVYEIESGKPSLYSDRLFATLRLLGARLTVEAEVDDPTPGDRVPDDPVGENTRVVGTTADAGLSGHG